jgi:hypothetical protein
MKLPASLTEEEAKSGLASAKEEWAKAQGGFKFRNVAGAVSTANPSRKRP